ncbi:VIT1/CCC1 transporter family protein [Moraxella porci]|uniref:VIT1/CCC1 transporter family protein n=1 Tax=Moraxella porci TaxID=1288392 RepID=UPI00244963D6|nr:VIT family protein [Moraxella porci]MDH2273555.1 VIT family protein [Moraxella porci]
MRSIHPEPHFSNRNNWLRATVLGANDGLISTASLLMGVAAAGSSEQTLILTGVASLIAGAISMAAGEYVSVSSQADTEKADLAKEAYELMHNPDNELKELTQIYQSRGLDADLAAKVAKALTKHDALQAHARDEIGLNEDLSANPLQAALASAASFVMGAILPLFCVYVTPQPMRITALWIATLVGLALLGMLSAHLGGANKMLAMARVVIWGVVALAATSLIGHFFGIQTA